ncbi:DUF4840 domain-containing protein [Prevotella sp. oral taxon 475]|jgi:hypothetical protein|uniref:DUF4840 domain-containing protein n=1 Tax=Prevotella sp. oral taxon 475 TaxID=712471 RepID=UPI001BAC5C33|nr:DUF4840 domain-containing protein [Prevotella sp. oral taxon 475]QUB46930.1 DUF4840 domain-containing protein [Prevotella sp. oral taxon 475]
MKKIKFLTMALSCMAVLGLTSCLSDNGNDNVQYKLLGTTEKTVYMNAITGSYKGKLKYMTARQDGKLDSTDITWTITRDSVLTVTNFPVKVLANYITKADVKATVESASPVSFKAMVKVPSYTLEQYYQQGYYLFGLLPKEKITFMAGTKKATVNYAKRIPSGSLRQSYLYPEIVYYKGSSTGYILVENVVIDSEIYEVNMPLLLVGKKQ